MGGSDLQPKSPQITLCAQLEDIAGLSWLSLQCPGARMSCHGDPGMGVTQAVGSSRLQQRYQQCLGCKGEGSGIRMGYFLKPGLSQTLSLPHTLPWDSVNLWSTLP